MKQDVNMPTTWEAWGGLATLGMFILSLLLALPRLMTLGKNWNVGSKVVSVLVATPDLLVAAPVILLQWGRLEWAVYVAGTILSYQLVRFAVRRAPPSRLEIGYLVLAALSFNFVMAALLQEIADNRFELLLSRMSQEAQAPGMPKVPGLSGQLK
ncbi:hypothetical protein D3C85_1201460 [compost metagenome]